MAVLRGVILCNEDTGMIARHTGKYDDAGNKIIRAVKFGPEESDMENAFTPFREGRKPWWRQSISFTEFWIFLAVYDIAGAVWEKVLA